MLYNKNTGNNALFKENDVQIAQYLIDLAFQAVETGRPFPASLGESPFFVSDEGDKRIITHQVITVGEKKYCIGTMKGSDAIKEGEVDP